MEIAEGLGVEHEGQSGLTVEQLEHQRMLAMRAWEMRPPRRTKLHPKYRIKRTEASRSLLWHSMGALGALGALMLIATF